MKKFITEKVTFKAGLKSVFESDTKNLPELNTKKFLHTKSSFSGTKLFTYFCLSFCLSARWLNYLTKHLVTIK